MKAMVASSAGYGFRFPLGNLAETSKSGRKIMSLKEGEVMLAMELMTAPLVVMVSEKGKGVVVQADQISVLSGAGRGVKLIGLGDSQLLGDGGRHFEVRRNLPGRAAEHGQHARDPGLTLTPVTL